MLKRINNIDWQYYRDVFWWKVAPGIIVLGVILLVLFLLWKLSDWVIKQPFWNLPLLEWLQTATIGEVVLLFGGVLFIVRAMTTSSVTVKKEK